MINPKKEVAMTQAAIYGWSMLGIGFLALVFRFLFGRFAVLIFGPMGGLVYSLLVSILILGGIAVLIVTYTSGLRTVVKQSRSDEVNVYPSAKINTRFALTKDKHMVFPYEPDPTEQLGWQYYVKIDFADGRKGEFRCNAPIYFAAAEGAKGTVTIRGDWFEAFEMDPPVHQSTISQYDRE